MKRAIPCGDNPATPCLPPQNRTSEGVLGVTAQAQSNSWLDNFTGPHYGTPCKDSPSTMCYYPAPSTQQQQSQLNGTTIFGFGLPSFAKTHNNITTNLPGLPGGCLDDPAVACGR